MRAVLRRPAPVVIVEVSRLQSSVRSCDQVSGSSDATRSLHFADVSVELGQTVMQVWCLEVVGDDQQVDV